MSQPARVLIIAGSDSGGGAGIQADIKSVTALGGFATTAVTALTAQNTVGVQGVVPVAPDFIAQQMTSVLDDIGTDCGKTGMLHSRAVIETVADGWRRQGGVAPLVVDPVMVAQSGDRLLEDDAVGALREHLVPLAHVLTPNRPEAEVLAGRGLGESEDPASMAWELLELGCDSVLLKGGHAAGDEVVDVLVRHGRDPLYLRYPRVVTHNDHGTGCTLASAIAAGLAQGRRLDDAVARARAYLQRAIEQAPGLGRGSGPVHHGHTVTAFEVTGGAS
jgi:hydroxymethylpyrimidine/phosphomethylpyrimidine kinase